MLSEEKIKEMLEKEMKRLAQEKILERLKEVNKKTQTPEEEFEFMNLLLKICIRTDRTLFFKYVLEDMKTFDDMKGIEVENVALETLKKLIKECIREKCNYKEISENSQKIIDILERKNETP